MGTISTSSSLLGSSTTSSTPSTASTTPSTATPTYFNGTSSYSSDLQNEISHEIQIASLPITQLQDDETTINNESSALTGLTTQFTNLQNAVQEIDTAVSGSNFEPDISDTSVLSANVSDGAVQGNYSVLVSDVGAASTSLTTNTWQDTTGAAQTYQLVVGGQSYNITPTDNSAASVASAINSQEGDKVQATVVNVGSQSTPDYRISLQSTTLDSNPVDLQLNGTSLQTQQVTGRPAQYEVNDSGTTVSSNTDTVTIASGLTVTMLQSSTTPVNITLTRSSAALGTALSDFTTAYNNAVDAVDAQRGQSGGALQGTSVVLDLSNMLDQIGTYADESSSVNTLASLGLTLDDTGHLTFDQSTLLSTDLTDSSAVNTFLGGISTGGFLETANNDLTDMLDPTTGELTTTASDYQTQITNINTEISTKQDQVNQLQTQLTNEMASADALIASLQQQQSSLSSMFQAEQVADLQIANE